MASPDKKAREARKELKANLAHRVNEAVKATGERKASRAFQA